MSKVQQITAAMQQLAPDELRQVQDWLENFLEDELPLSDAFKAKIERGEQDLREGRIRIRKP